ncbi:MAG: TolC family protein [Imperialibacter sp.]|uniref:TolC family protein n=1 Tax=Imperialibacter sp. TaxID=2038411 RepID=UPI0032F072A6
MQLFLRKAHLFQKASLRMSMLTLVLVLLNTTLSLGQSGDPLEVATLDKVVEYALAHQPNVQQALIDEEITDKAIKGKLADWYPQVNFTYNYQRFIDLQASVIGGNVIRFGVNNTSSAQFSASQAVFNRDVLLASSTASQVRSQAGLNTSRSKIDVVMNVAKAFYDALAMMQQIEVSEESIVRLERSLKDAQSRYNSGVSDKTDYKRATILLTNAKASLKTNQELLKYKQEYLKTLMGYPLDQNLPVQYDPLLMEEEIMLDTTQQVNYADHIDFQIMQSQKSLQEANVNYSRWAFLPSVSLFGNYNLNYQNNNFSDLYNTTYPFSFVGVTLGVPLLQGGKRLVKIQEANLSNGRLDLGLKNLKSAINTEYTRALASYKSNLGLYQAQKDNVELAEEVYDIIQLQYQSGVKTYLEVTIAESDLRTTRINYYNALYMVLASKMDVLKALGQINY